MDWSRTVRRSRPSSSPSRESEPAKKPPATAWYMPSMKRATNSGWPEVTCLSTMRCQRGCCQVDLGSQGVYVSV